MHEIQNHKIVQNVQFYFIYENIRIILILLGRGSIAILFLISPQNFFTLQRDLFYDDSLFQIPFSFHEMYLKF